MRFPLLALLLGLAGCGPSEPVVSKFAAPEVIDIRTEPPARPGECWDRAASQTAAPELGSGVALWVQVPCPATVTPEFIASLQRALAARGLFEGPVTGLRDAPTAAAIRSYQAGLGLDSPVLSHAAATRLGLIVVTAARAYDDAAPRSAKPKGPLY